jgi:methylaspartate ammonia-lyase
MRIKQTLFVPGYAAFFFDDQKAIKAGARHDGFVYDGQALTPGFSAIRQAGECVSVLLVLDNGYVAMGDCAAVQYSGAGGRDPLFLANRYLPFMERHLRPFLDGLDAATFLDNAQRLEALQPEGRPLHTAIRYGVSQALLDAAAGASGRLKAEVVCREYGLPVVAEPVPLFAQSGDNRYEGVDKMILKRADVLPHGLINNVDEKLGRNGEKLDEYIRWLVARVERLRPFPEYRPALHLDVYGTIGLIFGQNPRCVADYVAGLERAAGPLPLYIEGPVDMGSKPGQITALAAIKERLTALGSRVKIVADEWCNTYEDAVEFTDAQCCHMIQIKTPDLGGIQNTVRSVLYCNRHGMESYQGGTCNETDVSARTCVHLAIAARPRRMLVKPGMGFDEGMNVVYNEMARTIAVLKSK